MYKLLLVFFLLLPVLSFGFKESQVGNGGIGIVCEYPNGQVKSVELLEFVEGLVLESYNYAEAFSEPHLKEFILQRIYKIAPNRAALYAKYLNSFSSESIFKKGVEIADPKDTLNFINRKGCEHKTLVLQTPYDIPGTPKYIVNQDLFFLMPTPMQIMTVFHEIIYRERIWQGDFNSSFTRAFNSLLFSDKWDENNNQRVYRLFRNYNIPIDIKKR
ncbi:MAG: hypothetical protein VX642_06410 [Bdellovibrionota bacterium]|nr:hypothetical protein [Bdellovibrionota bacterium]